MQAGHDAANLEAMTAAVAYQAAMAELVAEKLAITQMRAGVLLDFGAGRGDYIRALQPHTGLALVGLEPDTALHVHYPDGVEVVSSLAHLTCAPAAAYSLNVLEHVADDVGALQALAARCAPGAAIFILVPAHPELWTTMDTLVGHRRRYTATGLRALAEAAGLTVVDEGWFDRVGYLATRAFQVLGWLRKERHPGVVSSTQVRVFDALFAVAEPLLSRLRLPRGKNCWILARR